MSDLGPQCGLVLRERYKPLLGLIAELRCSTSPSRASTLHQYSAVAPEGFWGDLEAMTMNKLSSLFGGVRAAQCGSELRIKTNQLFQLMQHIGCRDGILRIGQGTGGHKASLVNVL